MKLISWYLVVVEGQAKNRPPSSCVLCCAEQCCLCGMAWHGMLRVLCCGLAFRLKPQVANGKPFRSCIEAKSMAFIFFFLSEPKPASIGLKVVVVRQDAAARKSRWVIHPQWVCFVLAFFGSVLAPMPAEAPAAAASNINHTRQDRAGHAQKTSASNERNRPAREACRLHTV